MSDDTKTTKVHESVGLPDGHVDDSGEKIVYEYDAEGSVIGWHKEPVA